MADDNPYDSIIRDAQKNDSIYTEDGLAQVVKELLHDELAEDFLKNSPLWSIVSKSFKLSFFDERETEYLRHRFKESKISYRASVPAWKWTIKHQAFLDNLDNIFEANLNRAKGFEEGRLNERILISSQIKHATTVLAETSPVKPTGIRGFIGKVFGR